MVQQLWADNFGGSVPPPPPSAIIPLVEAWFPKIGATLRVCTQSPRRVVVFSARLATIAMLQAALNFLHVPAHPFVGTMSGKARDEALTAWRKNGAETGTPSILVMTYEAGGVGLNLHDGDAVVHMDPPTTQLLQQAQYRVQRPPRTTPVNVVFVQAVMFDGEGHTLDHAIREIAEARFAADAETMLGYLSGRADAAEADAAAEGRVTAQAAMGASSGKAVATVGSLCSFIQKHHGMGHI